MVLLAVAAHYGYITFTVDFPAAFLGGWLKRFVYVVLHGEFAELILRARPELVVGRLPNGSIIVKAVKSIYGLAEAAKVWFDKMSSDLLALGYSQDVYERCIFTKFYGEYKVMIALYVDDLLVCVERLDIKVLVLAELRGLNPDITVSDGNELSYLGMKLVMDYENKIIKVSMPHYIEDLSKKYGVIGNSKVICPNMVDFEGDDDMLLDSKQKDVFRSAVMSVMYLAKKVRVDVLFACSILASKVNKPTVGDKKYLSQVLEYLSNTKDYGIIFNGNEKLDVKVYVDASYGIHQDGKSHSGVVILMGSGIVYAKSCKQSIVVKSSTEAELVAASDHAGVYLELKNVLNGLLNENVKVVLMQDNKSSIKLIENGRLSSSERTKHISIRYFWLKERVDSGDICVEYCKTEVMLANILTKALVGKAFRDERDMLIKNTRA
jgi:hypothetical protein